MGTVGATEKDRRNELDRYAILDTPPEPELDALTSACARLLDAPMAFIVFLDGHRQWLKSIHGPALGQLAGVASLCQNVLQAPEPLVVADLAADPRFADHPLVAGPARLRFFAAVPLVSPDGFVLGALAAVDVRPREAGKTRVSSLRVLADLILSHLERRRAALASGVSGEVRLETIFHQLPALVWTTDRELRIKSSLGGALRLMGVEATELIGRRVDELMSETDAMPLRAHRSALAGESMRFDRERGDLSFDVYIEPLRDVQRNIVGTLGLAIDLTEQRAAEAKLKRSHEALRQSEERYQLVGRASNDAVWDWDIPSGRVDWSEGIATVFRYRKGEVRPHIEWWRERIAPEDRERVRASFERSIAAGDESWSCEYRFAYGDGTWAEVIDRGFVLRDDKGGVTRLVGSMLDVTARNLLHARLRQADRLASAGTLASGVAHEINNPLSFVVANIAFALGAIDRFLGAEAAASTEELAEAQHALTDAARGAERVRKIVQDLRIFARGNDERREPLDLQRVLDASLEITKNTVRHSAQLSTRIEVAPAVMANEAQLAQVFINLIVNAAEAIGVGRADRNRIEVRTFTGAGDKAIIEIADTGPGIAKDVLPHIFDPFFTTKAVGNGRGLGLAICHGIIKTIGGVIEIDSELGVGTTVRLVLPSAPRIQVTTYAEPAGPVVSATRRRLLIIDDEPQVLSALRRLLQREHDVEVESEAQAALARLERGERFDLILCDLMMPRMSGVEFLGAVKVARPDLAPRVVFMTGGAFTEEARAFLREVPNPFLDKPIDPDRLRALVREVANRPVRG